MKNLILTISFILTTVATIFAQNSTGHVTYKVDLSSDDPQMQMALPMFAGTTFEMYFTGNNSRTELNMGTFMSTVTITDIKKDKILMLLSGMMGNLAVPSTLSELEEKARDKKGNERDPQDDNIETEEDEEEYKITFSDETKEIEGYKCKKAIVTTKDGLELIYWYTEEIEIKKDGQNYFNKDVPGFPMEFETFNNGIKMTMTVTEYNKELGKDESELFDFTIPDGYKEMTFDELEGLGKKM